MGYMGSEETMEFRTKVPEPMGFETRRLKIFLKNRRNFFFGTHGVEILMQALRHVLGRRALFSTIYCRSLTI